MPAKRLTKLLPKHLEIARRIVYSGLSQREIAKDVGISEGRLSVIVNSPIFQLELKRLQKKRDDEMAQEAAARIFNRLSNVTEKALEAHEKILGCEDLPLPLQQRSATDIINLYVKAAHKGSSPLDLEEQLEVPYEHRLKEVLYREVSTIPRNTQPKPNYPTSYGPVTPEDDEDVMQLIERYKEESSKEEE